MPSQHLRHDTAFLTAKALLEIIAPCLREEERRDAFEELFKVCKEALERYEELAQREAARICKPSRN